MQSSKGEAETDAQRKFERERNSDCRKVKEIKKPEQALSERRIEINESANCRHYQKEKKGTKEIHWSNNEAARKLRKRKCREI